MDLTIALIDADILVYEALHRSIVDTDFGDDYEGQMVDMGAARADFAGNIKTIAAMTDASRVILAVTSSERDANFRRRLMEEYKAHRAGHARPVGFKKLRAWVRKSYETREWPGVEADDVLGILATGHIKGIHHSAVRVVCSIDKDLLTIPGLHYNWRKPELGVFDVSEDQADREHLLHTLIGDRADGFPGCPGIGPARAERILAAAEEDPDPDLATARWAAVLAAFEKAGLDEEAALANARCARILRATDYNFEKGEPILWTPPGGVG